MGSRRDTKKRSWKCRNRNGQTIKNTLVQRKKKIVFLLNTLGVGGSERKVIALANSMAASGEDVCVAYFQRPDNLANTLNPSVSVSFLDRQSRFSFGSLRRLRSIIAGRNVEVVSVYLYPLLYLIPWRRFLRANSMRVTCLINTTDLTRREKVVVRVLSPLLRACDQLVFGCRFQMNKWLKLFRLAADRSVYVYNGIDEEYFSPAQNSVSSLELRRELGIGGNAYVIGGVGRLAPEKNFQMLVMAVKELTQESVDTHLIHVGDGPEFAAIRELATRLGVANRIHLLGLHQDTRALVSAMDVFVLPSQRVETFSNAALEAMAMAKPVVLSDIGGASEMVEDNVSGYLFESGDSDGLHLILKRLSESGEIRESIGVKARERVIERFRFEQMLARYRELLSLSGLEAASGKWHDRTLGNASR